MKVLWKCCECNISILFCHFVFYLVFEKLEKKEEEELKFNIDIFPIYIVPNQNRNKNKLKREKANYNMAFGNFMI